MRSEDCIWHIFSNSINWQSNERAHVPQRQAECAEESALAGSELPLSSLLLFFLFFPFFTQLWYVPMSATPQMPSGRDCPKQCAIFVWLMSHPRWWWPLLSVVAVKQQHLCLQSNAFPSQVVKYWWRFVTSLSISYWCLRFPVGPVCSMKMLSARKL